MSRWRTVVEHTRSPWFDEIVGFLRDVQKGNIDAAGALADFLEERDCPEHRRRGVLLRRRWKMWKRTAPENPEHPYWNKRDNDALFLLYLRDKFGQEMYEASDPRNSEAYLSS